MVKKFRRAAAGVEEQLPSDLRPPEILRRTCDYLFDQVLSETSLGQAHHFLWDRTRAIRNDFSIQQCAKVPDVRIQIECLERIARFHIISMHQLATEKKPYDAYDNFQDREQLDKTLLTLMELYDANRSRYRSPNEAEFRAYCILFEMKSLVPNIEDRIQSWEPDLIKNPQVRQAVKLFNAACDTIRPVGPLNPRIGHPTAQGNAARFFRIVESSEVSYLMACVAEIEFKSVRESTLNSIWQAYRTGGKVRTEDWTMSELTRVLAFDDDEETRTFCEAYSFSIDEKADGTEFLDLTSVLGKQLPSAAAGLRKQFRSENLVEPKRCGRSLSAVINGLTVQEATQRGLIVEEVEVPAKKMPKESSLFVGQHESDTDAETATTSSFATPTNPFAGATGGVFGKPANSTPAFSFGKPPDAASGFSQPPQSISPFGNPATSEGTSSFGQQTNSPAITTFGKPAASGTSSSVTQTPASISPFNPTAASDGSSMFGKPAAASNFSFGKPEAAEAPKPVDSSAGQPSAGAGPTSFFGAPGKPAETSVFGKPANSPLPMQSSPFGKPPTSNQSPFGKPPGPFTEVSKEAESESILGISTPPATTMSGFSALPAFAPNKPPSTSFFQPQSKPASTLFNTSKNPTDPSESTTNPAKPPVNAQVNSGAATPPGSPPKSTPFNLNGTGAFAPAPTQSTQPSANEKNPFGFTPAQIAGTSSSGFQFKPSTSTAAPPSATAPSPSTNPPPSTKPQQPPSLGLFNPLKQSSPNLGNFVPKPPPSQATSATPNFSLGGASTKPEPSPPKFESGGFATKPSQPSAPTFSLGGPSLQPPNTTSDSSANPVLPKSLPSFAAPAAQVKFASEDLEKTKASVYQKITENLVLEPTSGLLTQFVEHKAEEIIRNALRQFEQEQEEQLANEFRANQLSLRYVKLWKDSCAAAKHKRRARERRKARRTAVISASRGTRDSRIENDVQDFKSTMTASTMRRSISLESDRNGFKDSFSSSIGIADIMARQNRSMDPPPRPPSTASDRSAAILPWERRSASHSRSQALAPQNEDFRVSKQPARYRASFLSGQPLIPPGSNFDGRISTTKTDFFRLKAMGINPDDVYPNRRKRVRDAPEGFEFTASRSTTPPDRKKRAVSREQPTATPSSISRADDADANDPLVAKCRSLTKSFMDDINALRSLREENERESLRHSQSSMDDPLARSYSDFRSSHFGKSQAAPTAASSSLPKYWGRQSKFLPRSEYGGARWLANKPADKGKTPDTMPAKKPGLGLEQNRLPKDGHGVAQTSGSTAASHGPPQGAQPKQAQSTQSAPDVPLKSNGVPAEDPNVIVLSSDDEDATPADGNGDDFFSANVDDCEVKEEEDEDHLADYGQTTRDQDRGEQYQHAEDDYYGNGDYDQAQEEEDLDDEIHEEALIDEEPDDDFVSDNGYSGEEEDEAEEGVDDEQGDGEGESEEQAEDEEEEEEDEQVQPQVHPSASKYRNTGNSIEDAIEL